MFTLEMIGLFQLDNKVLITGVVQNKLLPIQLQSVKHYRLLVDAGQLHLNAGTHLLQHLHDVAQGAVRRVAVTVCAEAHFGGVVLQIAQESRNKAADFAGQDVAGAAI